MKNKAFYVGGESLLDPQKNVLEDYQQKKLGQILLAKNFIKQEDLVKTLQQQEQINATSKRQFKLGELLLFAKKINIAQLQVSLEAQKPDLSIRKNELRTMKNRIKKH